jgi:hypothetical protein
MHGSAEGATAPETLRQKDRSEFITLKSCRDSSPGTPQEQVVTPQGLAMNLSGTKQRGRTPCMVRGRTSTFDLFGNLKP